MLKKIKQYFKPKVISMDISEPCTSTRIGFPEYPTLKSAYIAVVKITTVKKVWSRLGWREITTIQHNTSLVATRTDKTKPKIKFTFLSNRENEQDAINETLQKFFLKVKAHDIKKEFLAKVTHYDKR